MNKYIVPFVFLFLCLSWSLAQDSLSYKLTITDEMGGYDELIFGVHKNATHQIDFELGEEMTPEFPPPDGLYSVLFITDSIVDSTYWSYVDFRPILPYEPFVRFYRLAMFNLFTPYTIQWTELGENVDSAFIIDILNGQLIHYDMKENTTFYNENDQQDQLNIVVYFNHIEVDVKDNNDFLKNEKLKIIPNPVHNVLLFYAEKGFTHYKIVNTQGIIIQDGYIQNGKNLVDLSSNPSGIYFLVLNDINGNFITEKIVKY
jgi:hypothetical protein